jgi:hypothetical protein
MRACRRFLPVTRHSSRLFWWTGEGSNLRRPHGSADLQSAAFDRSATCPLWIPRRSCGRQTRMLPLSPESRIHLSQVDPECGWAWGHLSCRAILIASKFDKPAPNSPDWRPAAAGFLAAVLAQAGAGEGIRTPDPLITNQMLYRLSYASRPKPIIILVGSQIARQTRRFSLTRFAALTVPHFPTWDSTSQVPDLHSTSEGLHPVRVPMLPQAGSLGVRATSPDA